MIKFDYSNAEKLKEYYLTEEKALFFDFDIKLDHLDEGYKKALPKLIKALQIIDTLFLIQDHPQSLEVKNKLIDDYVNSVTGADVYLDLFNIFNGPERIDDENNTIKFFDGIKDRPRGGTVYPEDVNTEELKKYFENETEISKRNTIVRRLNNNFTAVTFEKEYFDHLKEASQLLESASNDIKDKEFSQYLKSRSKALLSGDYFSSEIDWINSVNSPIDLTIGLLEEYEDRLFSKKAFYSGLLCVKNPVESDKVSEYINHLQELENSLPQDIKLAKDMKKINVPVSVVDVLFMAGDLQAKKPGMIVAQTLPNDEKIIQQHGRKILIYKNILEGMKPNQEVLDKLIDKKLHVYCNQKGNINFTIGHEVGHSLGLKLSLKKDDKGNRIPVDSALGFYQGIIEELKADLVSLHNAPYLLKQGLYSETEAKEIYTYGGLRGNLQLNKPNIEKDTHAVGRLIKFNYFLKNKALLFDGSKFSLDFDKLIEANDSLLKEILIIQANGDIKAAEEFTNKWGNWSDEAKYVSEVAKKCKIKIYKVVKQSTAEKLLN